MSMSSSLLPVPVKAMEFTKLPLSAAVHTTFPLLMVGAVPAMVKSLRSDQKVFSYRTVPWVASAVADGAKAAPLVLLQVVRPAADVVQSPAVGAAMPSVCAISGVSSKAAAISTASNAKGSRLAAPVENIGNGSLLLPGSGLLRLQRLFDRESITACSVTD